MNVHIHSCAITDIVFKLLNYFLKCFTVYFIFQIFTDNLGYTEKHKYIDIRLAISFAGCATALFALGWDYFHPFPLSRPILIACVLSYPFYFKILLRGSGYG